MARQSLRSSCLGRGDLSIFGPLITIDSTAGDVTLPPERSFALTLVLQGEPADDFRLFVPYPPQVAGAGQCSFFCIVNQTRRLCFVQTTSGTRAPAYAGHCTLILVDPLGNAQLAG
jgi:hypothetical protein